MGFPVIDITHKPRRKQADNLREAQKVAVVSSTLIEEKNSVVLTDIPTGFITLEKAIAFYEKQSDNVFFKLTAKWLEDFLVYRKAAIKEARKQIQGEEVNINNEQGEEV